MAKHTLMGGKLHLYRRPNSSQWQCSTCLDGYNRRRSTKTDSLDHAIEIAEDWYLGLRGKRQAGELHTGKTFRVVAEQFLKEYEVLTEGQRSPKWVKLLKQKLDRYLVPYFGPTTVSEITPGKVQEYRVHRAQNGFWGTPPARNTVEHEIIALRQVLKTAVRHRWLDYVPNFSPPFKASRKVSHRAWFSPQEYRQLYETTREAARSGASSVPRTESMLPGPTETVAAGVPTWCWSQMSHVAFWQNAAREETSDSGDYPARRGAVQANCPSGAARSGTALLSTGSRLGIAADVVFQRRLDALLPHEFLQHCGITRGAHRSPSTAASCGHWRTSRCPGRRVDLHAGLFADRGFWFLKSSVS